MFRKSVLFIVMTAVVLAGCVQKAGDMDTAAEADVVKALETNESVENTHNDTKIYMLKADREEVLPQIIIDEDDKSFSLSYDVMSSYLAVGTYTENSDQFILKTDDGKYQYTFDITDGSEFITVVPGVQKDTEN